MISRLALSVIALAVLSSELVSVAQTTTDSPIPKAKQREAAPARALPNSIEFKATAAEMDAVMRAENAATLKDPLQFPKGNGVRLLMTGHSWVAPAVRTLPGIAKAAGFDGHHQRSHTSGGSTGSANAIWLTEFGKFKDKPKTPILLPAIATGQWDVMTWGAYYLDKPQYYSQWIDVCLKHNSNMVFFIQDGWTTYAQDFKDTPRDEVLKTIDAAQTRIQSSMFKELYTNLNATYPGKVHIIPAGPAVVEMLHHYYEGKLPGYDQVSTHLGGKKGVYRDGAHLDSDLEHLVGYVYFGMLYKKSPALIKEYRPSNIAPEVDRLMRTAAWNAIKQSPFSGITDRDDNGVAD